jgi:DNA invertase Pin-like site-specific DNA recombinase
MNEFIKRKYNLSDESYNKIIYAYKNQIKYYKDQYINFYWNLRRHFIISEIASILGVSKQTLYNFNVNMKKYDTEINNINNSDIKELNYVRSKLSEIYELLGLIINYE